MLGLQMTPLNPMIFSPSEASNLLEMDRRSCVASIMFTSAGCNAREGGDHDPIMGPALLMKHKTCSSCMDNTGNAFIVCMMTAVMCLRFRSVLCVLLD
jgi:hypothetical protein